MLRDEGKLRHAVESPQNLIAVRMLKVIKIGEAALRIDVEPPSPLQAVSANARSATAASLRWFIMEKVLSL